MSAPMFADLPLAELRRYPSEVAGPPAFDGLWVEQLSYTRGRLAPAAAHLADVVDHVKRVFTPGLFSAGLIDDITPTSTVFAAHNQFARLKDIAVHPFIAHEGGRRGQGAKLDFLTDHLSEGP